MAKSEQELLETYRKRIRQQNEHTKEKYDKITATLPKGTIERIRAQGLTISEVVNKSVLEYLERLEGLQGTSTPVQETPEEIPEFQGLKPLEWKREVHSGKVPFPPREAIEDEQNEYTKNRWYWDGYEKEWHLIMPFD